MAEYLNRVIVTAPFANTYRASSDVEVDIRYRVKKGFIFETTVSIENERLFIENPDTNNQLLNDKSKLPFGRWIPEKACKIVEKIELKTGEKNMPPYDADECDVNIRVLGENVHIAKSIRAPINTVECVKNSIFECDLVSYLSIDGVQIVRYHISDCDYSELIGQWIQLDGLVAIDYERRELKSEQFVGYSIGQEGPVDTLFAEKAASTNPFDGLPDPSAFAPAYSLSSEEVTSLITGESETVAFIADTNQKSKHKSDGHNVTYYLVTKTKSDGSTEKWVRSEYQDGWGNTQIAINEKVSDDTTLVDVRMDYGGMSEAYATSTQKEYRTSTYENQIKPGEEQKEAAENSDEESGEPIPFEDSSQAAEFGGDEFVANILEGYESVNLASDDGYQQLMDLYDLSYDNQSLMSIPLDRMNFVHGIPFQFNTIADRRRGSNTCYEAAQQTDLYGMVFAREILAQVPIVVFVPGKPQFLTKLKAGFFGTRSDSKSSVKDQWMPLISTNSNEYSVEAALANILNEGGDYDYYTMDVDMTGYYNHVNMLCKMCARNMGLTENLPLTTGERNPIHINWNNYNKDVDANCTNDAMLSVLGLDQGVSFAFDPQSSITDSLSNSTTESQIAGLLNQVSATARELGFITGQASQGTWTIGAAPDGVDWDEIAADYKSGATNGKFPVVDSVVRYIGGATNGLNVRFPEIWNDSNQTKSYSCDMHFVAPYATSLCVWRHVLVPFWHIFALAAPQSNTHITVYDSPFLIRAFSKGYFNVEMGIIESLSYKRFGDGDMITANGIPTQIDVTVDFKDMYHMLAITPYHLTNMKLFFNNAGLIELIGTLSGVNMNRLGLGERLSLYVYAGVERVRSLGSTFMQHVRDRVRNIADSIYYGV